MSISLLLEWQRLVGSLDEESSFADQGSFAEPAKDSFLKKNQENSRNVIVCVMHTVAI